MVSAFQRHGEVDRILLLIHDGQVYELFAFLMRWRCTRCARTFRNYPEGVYPYKRYVAVVLVVLCRRFLHEPCVSYRLATQHRSVPIAYAHEEPQPESPDAQKECEEDRRLAHSTLWRWLSLSATWWIGLRQRAERRGRVGTVDLSCWRIAPAKYRSAERRQTLILAAKSLSLWPSEKFPTEIETRYGGP